MPPLQQKTNGKESSAELRTQVAASAVALRHQRTKLRDQRRILKSVIDSLAEGLIVADSDGKVLLWNRAARQILGISPRDAAPEEWSRVYGLYLSDRVTLCPAGQLPLARVSRGESVDACELFVRNSGVPEGTWISVTARPVKHDDGTLESSVLVIRDISRFKRAEEIVAQQQRELERSNHDLEQFAYAASHDLQEPLRAVSGYCQLLQRRYEEQLEPKAREFIAQAVAGARRMQALIEGLLAYSRVGRRGNMLMPTEADSALDRALVNLETAICESGATVTRDPLPTVVADSTQLMLVFQNLIGNAIKYHSHRLPEIHVSASKRDKDWLFSVRDNGIGIHPQYKDRIFLIFQRLHTRNEYPGTGIGLAICRRIIERHRGQIWVESAPGEGSTFFFTLPLPEGAG
ncbi:MAG TPA: ATP-binding protein [Planctomycetaceae bacterium]|nr:ATP-binding protein [Planctomycetaceae bacterium]